MISLHRSSGASPPVAPPQLAWSFTTTDHFAPDVSPAPDGGVYVTSTFGVSTQASLTRYDAAGSQVWRRELPTGTRGAAVSTDASGNVYLSGETSVQLTSANNVLLRKYSPNGDTLWSTSFGTALDDWPTGLAVDAGGNGYVASGPWATNYGVPPAGTATQLRRFNANGALSWLQNISPQDGSHPGGGASSWNQSVVSGDGYVYSAFTNYLILAPDTFGYRSYLSKLTLDGQLLWTKTLGDDMYPAAIGVDSRNDLYIAAGYDFLKLDGDGNVLWEKTNNSWRLFSLTVGPGNRIFVGGDKELEPYLAEYDADGNLIWSHLADQPEDEWTTFYGLAVSGENLMASAQFSNNGFWAGNLIQAYHIIPEPTGAKLVLLLVGILAAANRHRG